DRVVAHDDGADSRIAHVLQLVVRDQIHRADQFDAAFSHAELAIGLHHAGSVRAGGNKDIHAIGFGVLDTLEEWREVGHLDGAAHWYRLGDFSAGLFETGLERFRGVLAWREVSVGHRRRLAADLVIGIGAHWKSRMPHAEREPRDIGREIGYP